MKYTKDINISDTLTAKHLYYYSDEQFIDAVRMEINQTDLKFQILRNNIQCSAKESNRSYIAFVGGIAVISRH